MLEDIAYYLRPSQLIIFAVVLFIGICFGWFLKKRGPVVFIFFALVGIMIFEPVLKILEQVDHWFLTVPFILGALIHPVASRLKQ